MGLQYHLFAVSLLVWGSSATLDIPTTTMYVNHNPEVLLRWHDCGNYTVPTCNYYSGTHNVKVKLFHPHNPQNDAHHGITYFAVVTKPPTSCSDSYSSADIVCSVTDSMNPYVPECTGAVPANTKYLYVYVHGSVTPNINYAISVTFEKTSVPYMAASRPAIGSYPSAEYMMDMPFIPYVPEMHNEELHPVINYEKTISLPYNNNTMIQLQFCPTRELGKYSVQTIFQADDPNGESLISQAVCNTTVNCDIGKSGAIAFNYDNLPVNTLSTDSKAWTTLWVYGLAMGGPLNSDNYPVGKFRFGATVVPVA